MAATKITSRVLADDAVVRATLGDDAIGTAEIADDAVTGALIEDNVALAGNPTTTTQSLGNSSTRIATTAFVQAAVDADIDALIDSAPGTMNTLDEIAAALNDDPTFTTTVNNAIALKAPLANPTFTGNATFDTNTLYVDGSNNRVGIGNTAPDVLLEVAGAHTSSIGMLHVDSSDHAFISLDAASSSHDKGIYFQEAGTAQVIIDHDGSANELRIHDGTNTHMVIEDGGNVGIGTTGPAKPLHISSSDNQPLRVESTDAYSGIELKDNGSATLPPLISALSDDFIFYGGHASARPALMFMDSSTGNVGIGETSPDYQLHIAGAGDLLVEDTGNGSAHIRLRSSNSGTATSNWKLKTSNNNYFYIDNDTGSAGTAIAIDNTGKVGIGTSSPSQALDLQGYFKMASNRTDDAEKHAKLMGIPYDSGSTSDIAGLYINGHVGGNFLRYGGGVDATSAATNHSFYTASLTTGAYEGTRRLYIDNNGIEVTGYCDADNFKINGAQGSDGQVLTSTGSGVAWEDAGGGGVTSLVETNSIWLGNDPSSTTNDAQKNVAVGTTALDAITSGDYNTAVGYNSLTNLEGGSQNNCFGSQSGEDITSGNYNVAIGQASLAANQDGSNNVAIGDNSIQFPTTVNNAIGIGPDSGRWATGAYNIGIGTGSIRAQSGSSGSENVAMGRDTLYDLTTGSGNTAIGHESGMNISSGNENVAVGKLCLATQNTGSGSTAVGFTAMRYNVSGGNNTAVGHAALRDCTASNNTALGSAAGANVETGSENVFIGGFAGDAVTTAYGHVFIGHNAGTNYGTSGNAVNNTIIGRSAGESSTSGGSNTFVGNSAGADYNSATTSCSVFIGASAGRGPIVGYHNVAIGMNAFGNTGSGKGTNAYGNTYVGHYGGYHTTSGDYNTSLGKDAGMEITTGNNNLLLGYQAGKSTSPSGEVNTASNILCLGDNNITNFYCADTSIASSDERDKTDITNFTGGLDWIKAMRPVTYKWDKRVWYVDEEEWDETGENLITPAGTSADILAAVPDGTHKKDSIQVGLLSQEVLTIEQANGFGSNNDTSLLVDLSEDETSYGLKYSRLVPILISAMKEQQTIIDDLKSRIETLEG